MGYHRRCNGQNTSNPSQIEGYNASNRNAWAFESVRSKLLWLMNLSSDPQNIYEKVQEWQHMSTASKHCQRRGTLPGGHWQASLIKFESFSFSKSPCLKNKGLRETLNNLWTLSYAHTHVQTYTQRQSRHPKPLRAGNQTKKGRWAERERNTSHTWSQLLWRFIVHKGLWITSFRVGAGSVLTLVVSSAQW